MEQMNEFRQNGDRENHRLEIRLSKSQKQRLQMLAEASGFTTVSAFVRSQCLNPSMEMKVNEILAILKKNKTEEQEDEWKENTLSKVCYKKKERRSDSETSTKVLSET